MPLSWRLGFAIGLIVGCAWLAAPSDAGAQYTVGRVEGMVMDASKAVLAGAAVVLRNMDTNATRTFTTGPDGLYVFFAVPPGNYQISAEASGFAKRTVDFQVVTSQTLTVNLNLAVRQQSAIVEVVGMAPVQLNVADSQRSVTLTALELGSLPNLARNMISVVSLAPGVQPTNNPRGGSTFGGGLPGYVITIGVQSGLIAVNGGRARASSIQLDYTDANDWELGGFVPGMQAITPDMLQEFKLLTSNFPAEYGVKSNAQILMVTKSGTNEWHGTAYDFVQNDFFNARDYLDRTGKPSKIAQNIYGFTMGGPVVKNRTFLFGGYEGRRTRGASFTNIVKLPSASARARAALTGDPIIVDLLNRFLPIPTTPTNDPDIGTLTAQIPSPVNNYQFIGKADHRFSDAHTISARYLHSTASFVARFPSLNQLPGFDGDDFFALRNVNITDSYVVSSRTVNELRLAYGRGSALLLPQNGLSTPRFQISGLVNFGALESTPTNRIFNVYQVNDLLSHVRGSHALKMGADIRKIQDNSLSALNSRGVFSFTLKVVPTGQPGSLDNFLAGQPSSWNQLFGNTQRAFRTGVYGFFFQDDWKLTPTLTLNLGLRWDIQGALGEAQGRSSILDPRTPGTIGAAGSGPLGSFRVGETAVEGSLLHPAPRVGFAWNPRGGNFVLRGGYGIYWDSFTFAPLAASRSAPAFNYLFSLSGAQLSGANSFDNLVNGSAPILAQANSQVGSFGNLTNFGAITSVDPRLPNPYVQAFSLGIQYRLFKSYVFDLSYVGTKASHLTRLVPINPVVCGPSPAISLADEAARLTQFRAALARENGPGNNRLDPRFDQVNFHDDGGSSIYHSLQAELRKNLSHGLLFQASYTWSKSIDDASDFSPTIQANDNSYPQDGSNPRGERAVSNYDIRHRIVVTTIWRVPFFHSLKGVAGKLLDGWSFESVNTWQTGLPATLLAGARLGISDVNLDGNSIRAGLDNTRANCDPAGARFKLGDPAGNFGFSQPLLGNNGTCGRNTIRMNSLANFDWAFFKDTQLFEKGPLGSGPWDLQFRAELYNIFNVPFLTATGDAWRTVSSPSFGQFNNAGSTRKMQFALRLTW
ncbi:MAG: TonB-dependent receptor [Acidobacteria bacterium]|nr:TonB-dependent receptor [Acidobacteriota bacterium]